MHCPMRNTLLWVTADVFDCATAMQTLWCRCRRACCYMRMWAMTTQSTEQHSGACAAFSSSFTLSHHSPRSMAAEIGAFVT